MARLLTTGFETGAVNENNGGLYQENGTTVTASATQKRTGSYAMKVLTSVLGTQKGYLVQVLPTEPQETYLRFALYSPMAGSGLDLDTKLAMWREGDNELVAIAINRTDLRLRLYVLGVEVDVGAAVISQSHWYMIEAYVKVANGGGAATVKVNGVTDLTYSGDTASSANEYADTFRLGVVTYGDALETWYFDDVALNDTDGSYQNSWPGLGGVYLLKPKADGAQNDWTPTSGSDHWEMVNEVPANSTDWVQGLDPGEIELYDVEACPDYINTIDVVEVVYAAAVVVSGSNQIEDIIHQGIVDYPGVTHTVVTIEPAYILYKGTPHYVQPDGSGAWGVAEVDAAQAGFGIP